MITATNREDTLYRIQEVIQEKMSRKDYLLVAIDGRCAAGKTTLANELKSKYSCNCIHMDDFFLRPVQRTPERFKEPGGNVDYERFEEEVLLPLSKQAAFSYRPFLCKTMDFGEPIVVEPTPVTIVEGSYACHPKLTQYYDLHIFLSISADEQLERIRKRNGEKMVEIFTQKWIPLEEKYFETYQISKQCELSIFQ